MFSAFSNPNAASSNPPNFAFPSNTAQSQSQTQTQVQNPVPIANAFAAPNPYVTQNQPAATTTPSGFPAPAAATSPGPAFSYASSPQPNGQTTSGAPSFTSNQGTTADTPASIFQNTPWPQQQQQQQNGSDEPAKFKFPRLAHNSNVSSSLSTTLNQQSGTSSTSVFDSQANPAQGSGSGSSMFNFANGGNNIAPTSTNSLSGSVLSGPSQKSKTPFAFNFQNSQQPSAATTFSTQSQDHATSFDSNNTTMDDPGNPFEVETETQTTINPSVFTNPSQPANGFAGLSSTQPASGGFPAFSAFAPRPTSKPPSAFTPQTASDNTSSAFSKPNAWSAPSVFSAPPTQQSSSFPNAFSTQKTGNGPSAFTNASAGNMGKQGRQPSPRPQKRKYDDTPSFPTGAGGTANSSYEDAWLTQVATCLEGKLGDGLAYLMSVGDKIDPEIEGLRGEMLRGALERNMDEKIDQKLGEDWKGFNVMVFAYLQYLRDLNDKLDMRFKATLRFADKLASAYSHPEGKLLNAMARRVTTYLTKLAFFIDEGRKDPRWTKTELAHAVFRKIFNASIGERTRDGLGKKELTLHFANILFKIYFKMGQTNMLQTMHNNIKSALRKEMIPAMASELNKHRERVDNPIESELWPKSERCTYAYYYGRTHFIYGRIKEARNALQEAYDLAPIKSYSQRRLILVYLVSSNVILGNFPSKDLYSRPEAVGFEDVFAGIVRALKLGHFRLFEQELFKSRSWLVHWHVFFELRNRCQPLLWRSLVKNTWQYNVNNGGTANKTARVAIQHILMSASAFHQGVENWPLRQTEMTKEHVEAALLSLLDQGLLDGYVSQPGGQTLSAFSKSRALFPKLRVIFDPIFKYHS